MSFSKLNTEFKKSMIDPTTLIKAYTSLDVFNNVIEALKPVNLVSTIIRMTDNTTPSEWGRDICCLAELYGPVCRDYWPLFEELISILRPSEDQTTPKEQEAPPAEQQPPAREAPTPPAPVCKTISDEVGRDQRSEYSRSWFGNQPDPSRRDSRESQSSISEFGDEVDGALSLRPNQTPSFLTDVTPTGNLQKIGAATDKFSATAKRGAKQTFTKLADSIFGDYHAGGKNKHPQQQQSAGASTSAAQPQALVNTGATTTKIPKVMGAGNPIDTTKNPVVPTKVSTVDQIVATCQAGAARALVAGGDLVKKSEEPLSNWAVLIQSVWHWGKDAIIALCSGLMTAFAIIGGLFPASGWFKKTADRLIGCLSNMTKLKNSSVDAPSVYTAVSEAFKKTVGEESENMWIKPIEWARVLKLNVQTFPHFVHHPAFPLSDLESLIKRLEDEGHKDKTPYGTWLRLKADECKTLADQVRRMKVNSPERPMPVVVCLAGSPGVGKTTFVKQLAERINGNFGTMGFDTWMCGLDHQDQITGKPVLVMEEFGLHDLEADMKQLQRLADTSTYVTDCDLLANKGRREAPAAIIVVTNHVNIYDKCKFPQAVARRIEFHAHVYCTALAAWKTKNPGRNPNDTDRRIIFGLGGPEFDILPACATDWRGSYLCDGVVQTSNTDPITATNLVMRVSDLVESRWEDITKGAVAAEHFKPCLYHGVDAPITLFLGEPGTGKSTLAESIQAAHVINDPWRSDSDWEAMIDAVMRAEDDGCHIIITANPGPWSKRLATMDAEVRQAVMRRINMTYSFSYNKKGLFGCYGPKDVHQLGWTRTVSIADTATNKMISYMGLVVLLNGKTGATRTQSVVEPIYHAVAYSQVASSSLTTHQLCKIKMDTSLFNHFTVTIGMSKLFPLIKELISKIPRAGGANADTERVSLSPSELVATVNDLKYECCLAKCSVAFANGTFNFWSEGESHVIQCALVDRSRFEEVNGPVEIPDLTPPAISADARLLMRTISNIVITVGGITCTALAARQRFHSPTKEECQNGTGSSERRVIARAGDAKLWSPPDKAWADAGEGTVDYSEIVRFDSLCHSMIACTTRGGDHLGWAFVHASGILINRHVYCSTTHLGPRKVGECLATVLEESDYSLLIPKVDPGYKRSRCALSIPVVGEVLSQMGPSGEVLQTARVLAMKKIKDPAGRAINVYTLDSTVSSPGDCGLPWVRHVGSNVEVAGLHTGLYGGVVMVSAAVATIRMHSGGADKNQTYIHKTQFYGVDKSVEDMRPSDKVWPDEFRDQILTKAAMVRRGAVVFFPKVINDNSVCRAAVDGAIQYVNMLVPEEKLTRWSLTATIKSLDMSTSAGPSYGCTKESVFSADGDILPKHSKTFWGGIRSSPRALCQISLKDELRPPKKIEAGLTRPIFVFDVHATIAVKQLVGSGLTLLAETAGSHPWCPGISYLGGGWTEMCDTLSKYKWAMDADFGRWDSTNSHALLRQGVEVMSHLAPKEDRSRVIEWWNTLMQAETQHGQVRTGLPSGVIGTAQLNCTSHVLVMNHILVKAGRAMLGEMGCPVAIFTYGDDIVIGMNDRGLADIITQGWKDLGFAATSADKSGPPQLCAVSDLQFLKRRLVKIEGCWRAPLELKSIWRAVSFGKGHIPYDHTDGVKDMEMGAKRCINAFQSAFSEFWQHGRAVFMDARRIMINWSKETGKRLPVVIPEYERFSPRDVLADANSDLGDSGVKILTVAFHVGGSSNQQVTMNPEQPMGAAISGEQTSGGAAAGNVVGAPDMLAPLAEPTPGVETTMGTTGGEMTLMDPAIRQRWAPLPAGTLSIRTNTPVGTILFTTPVNPGLNVFTRYLANMYNAWCGGFDVMMVVGANNFIGGKLAVIYTPPSRPANNYSLEELLCFDHAVMDIRMMDNVILNCSDIKNVLWHRTGDSGVDGIAGYFTIALMTNLITAGNAGVELSLDVKLFARPTLNFDFRMLIPPTTGSQETQDTWMSQQAEYLSYPATTVYGSKALNLVVQSNLAATVLENMWAGVSGLNGPSGAWCVPTTSPAGVLAKMIPSGATNVYWVSIIDDTGNVWDPTDNGGSNSLPINCACRLPLADSQYEVRLTWARGATISSSSGALSFSSAQSAVRFTCTDIADQPASTLYMLSWVPVGALARADRGIGAIPVFVPPNAESLVGYVSISTQAIPVMSLTTLQASTHRVNSPKALPGGTAALFNLRDAAGTTNTQIKLYPNGIMTSGGTREALLFSAPWKLEFVSTVSFDYKLRPPTGGQNLRTTDVFSSLEAWLHSQALRSEDPSLELQALLEALSGLQISNQGQRSSSSRSSYHTAGRY